MTYRILFLNYYYYYLVITNDDLNAAYDSLEKYITEVYKLTQSWSIIMSLINQSIYPEWSAIVFNRSSNINFNDVCTICKKNIFIFFLFSFCFHVITESRTYFWFVCIPNWKCKKVMKISLIFFSLAWHLYLVYFKFLLARCIV